jgi:hypothetical protein
LSNFCDAGRAAKDLKSLLALNRAAVCGFFSSVRFSGFFPMYGLIPPLVVSKNKGHVEGKMRFRTVAARAVVKRASPKTEREDQLRIAQEILEALRAAGWNAELGHGANGLADERLN